MRKTRVDYYKQAIEVLQELKSQYPSYSLGKHIATALDEYPDIWGLSDKEILFAFTKYKAQMQMDVPHETDEKELQRIIKDGMNLSLDTEEDEDYYG